ncbi:hypothetical protein AOLI_G00003960 [Acnodon oligacanthus]
MLLVTWLDMFAPSGSAEWTFYRAGLKVDDKMKLLPLLFCLLLLTFCSEANPGIKESFAKQLLRSKRQKPGYPDEPMREHMLHLQRLEQRARETNLENWLNPHCFPAL